MYSPRDNNHVPALMGVLCTDGVSPIPIAVDAGGNVEVDEVSIVLLAAINAQRDENHVPTLMGVSADDGVTPLPVYVNAAGKVLIAR